MKSIQKNSIAAMMLFYLSSFANAAGPTPTSLTQLKSASDLASQIGTAQATDSKEQAEITKKYTQKLKDWGYENLVNSYARAAGESHYQVEITKFLAEQSAVRYVSLYQHAGNRDQRISKLGDQIAAQQQSMVQDSKTSSGDIKNAIKARQADVDAIQAEITAAQFAIEGAAQFEIANSQVSIQQRLALIPDNVTIVQHDSEGRATGQLKYTFAQATQQTAQNTLDALRYLNNLDQQTRMLTDGQNKMGKTILALGLPSYVFIKMVNVISTNPRSISESLAPGDQSEVKAFAHQVTTTYNELSQQYDVQMQWRLEPTVDSVGTAKQNEHVSELRMKLAESTLQKMFEQSRRMIIEHSQKNWEKVLPETVQTSVKSLPDRGVAVYVAWFLTPKAQASSH